MRQWLDRQLATRSSQVLDRFRKARRFEDLGISDPSPWEIGQRLSEVLPELIRDDSQAAQKVFWRTVSLAEDAQKRSSTHDYFGNDQTLAGTIIEYTFRYHGNNDFDLKSLMFLIDLLRSPEATKLAIDNSMRYTIDNALRQTFETAQHGAAMNMAAPRRRSRVSTTNWASRSAAGPAPCCCRVSALSWTNTSAATSASP